MTVTLVKSGPSWNIDNAWNIDAAGHVLDARFFREARRRGANLGVLSRVQWEGYFGMSAPGAPKIDGIAVRLDPALPDDEIRFFENGALVAVMRRLYVPPSPSTEK